MCDTNIRAVAANRKFAKINMDMITTKVSIILLLYMTVISVRQSIDSKCLVHDKPSDIGFCFGYCTVVAMILA